MIKPTIGRIVWYYEPFIPDEAEQAQAAMVTYVHSDTLVNLSVFDMAGNPHGRTSVALRQPGDAAPSGAFCEWMPYQVTTAAQARPGLTLADALADTISAIHPTPRPDHPSV
jgi:hypothetical protein